MLNQATLKGYVPRNDPSSPKRHIAHLEQVSFIVPWENNTPGIEILGYAGPATALAVADVASALPCAGYLPI
jgi:hypothetical protein